MNSLRPNSDTLISNRKPATKSWISLKSLYWSLFINDWWQMETSKGKMAINLICFKSKILIPKWIIQKMFLNTPYYVFISKINKFVIIYVTWLKFLKFNINYPTTVFFFFCKQSFDNQDRRIYKGNEYRSPLFELLSTNMSRNYE